MGNPKTPFVLLAGLKGSGKTHTILGLLKLAPGTGAAKPFDTGLLALNAVDKLSDGELFNQVMAHKPHISLVNPYLPHSSKPFEYALLEEGSPLKSAHWHKLDETLKTLSPFYSHIWMEAPGPLYTPLAENIFFLDWAKKRCEKAIYIVSPEPELWALQLMELSHFGQSFPKAPVLINLPYKTAETHWLEYIWLKLEQELGLQVIGLVPYDPTPHPKAISVLQSLLSYIQQDM